MVFKPGCKEVQSVVELNIQISGSPAGILFFLAALVLCCCVWAFSSCGERGLLFIAVCGLLIGVASLVVEHGL